jgi:branched-chain amino acid transport system substrate-binding protein
LVWAGALAVCSCSLSLKFQECNSDGDCQSRRTPGGPTLYCTADHLCVNGIPDDRLCSTHGVDNVYGSSDPNALTIGVLMVSPTVPDTTVVTSYARANAVILGVEEINKIPNAQPVRIILCDTGRDADQTTRALKVAVQKQHVVAAVGPTTSDNVIALGNSSLLPELDVLLVSPSATSVSITDINPLVWRTAPSDALQAKVLATQIPASANTIDLAYADTTYGRGLDGAIHSAFSQRPLNSFSFVEGSDMTKVVDQLRVDMPGVALLVANPDAPALAAALANGGPSLAMTQYLMTDAARSPPLFGPPGHYLGFDLLGRIRGTAGGTPPLSDPVSGPVYATFSGSYARRFPTVSLSGHTWVANSYDAFYALVLAAATISDGQFSGHRLAAGMARLSTLGAPRAQVGPVDYLPAVSQLRGGGNIELVGSSGPLHFTDQRDVATAPIEIWKIVQGANGPAFATDSVVTP